MWPRFDSGIESVCLSGGMDRLEVPSSVPKTSNAERKHSVPSPVSDDGLSFPSSKSDASLVRVPVCGIHRMGTSERSP